MSNKPSYEELEQLLEAQKKEIASLRAIHEQLRESEEKFKTMFENANDHIAYVDMEDRIIDVNHKFEETFGHNRDDVKGKKFYDFGVLSPEAWGKNLEYTRKFIGNDPVQNPVLEFEAVDKDGNQVYLEVNPRAVIKDGKIVRFLSITEEITERKRAEEALRESEQKFRAIFENANDHIIYIGLDDVIIDINPRFEGVFGHTRDEIIGKKFYEIGILSPENWEEFIMLSRKLVAGELPQSSVFEFVFTTKNGETIYMETNPRVVIREGQPQGILCITRDVTERKHAEDALKQHQDQLERLVQERTSNLEEANTALRVMLKKAEEVRNEMGDRIMFNVKEFVFPYLEKLKKTELNETQLAYMDSMEENLDEITSPFLHGVSTRYMRLTPTEIQVANLVKQGKTTKEIAALLSMSTRTIDTHRYSIRNKLGVRNEKVNLRTYLMSSS